MIRVQLSDGIYLNIIETDKFKTDYFDFNMILPLREETASYAALLPLVLKRGCSKFPNMAEISKRFDYLYLRQKRYLYAHFFQYFHQMHIQLYINFLEKIE